MGAVLAKIMESPRMQQDRMHACLRLMHKVLLSQLGTLAVEGALLGYYLTHSYLIFKQEFESEEYISPMCPLCNKDNFQLVCRGCRSIVGCEECVKKSNMKACRQCQCSFKGDGLIKVFMN